MKNEILCILCLTSFALVDTAMGVIRKVERSEASQVRGGWVPDMHCVTLQPAEDVVACWTPPPPAGCPDPCWDHLDQDCVEGPPKNCTGTATYQNFSATCADCCMDIWGYCVNCGTWTSGSPVQQCYCTDCPRD